LLAAILRDRLRRERIIPMPVLSFEAKRLEAACEQLGLSLLVAYGSRAGASHEPRPDSDLDLALSLPGPRGWARLSDCLSALGEVFPDYTLDAVFLSDADPLFRWEIMREGKLLYGDPIAFLEYRAFAWKDFVDSADLRRVEAALFRKRMDWIREQLHAAA
jgi:predicted nucleotidyltransferase